MQPYIYGGITLEDLYQQLDRTSLRHLAEFIQSGGTGIPQNEPFEQVEDRTHKIMVGLLTKLLPKEQLEPALDAIYDHCYVASQWAYCTGMKAGARMYHGLMDTAQIMY